MKINTTVNGKDIVITLTKEQLAEIAKQTSSRASIDDINSFKDACEVLDSKWSGPLPSLSDQILKIVKAANYIDNNYQEWKPDFDNYNEYKYYPYFEMKKSSWVLYCLNTHYSSSTVPVGFYYKNKASGETLVKRFSSLYNNWIG